MAKVTFDGIARLISVNLGVTDLDAEIDLYSDWKEWQLADTNSRYAPAFRTTGGDPLPGGLELGAYFFLRNDLGWRIKPHEADHEMILKGNLYPEAGALPMFVPSVGGFTCLITLERSSLTQVVTVGGGGMDVISIAGDTVAAQNLQKSAALMVPGTVDATAFTSTLTEFESSNVAVSPAGRFVRRILFWRTGALAGQAVEIRGYSVIAGRGHFKVASLLTSSPLTGDSFLIV